MDDERAIRSDEPVAYRIVVQGRLATEWQMQLEGMQMETAEGPPPTTTLSGTLRDQAALHGVLRMLYGLGMPLYSVTLLACGEDLHEEPDDQRTKPTLQLPTWQE